MSASNPISKLKRPPVHKLKSLLRKKGIPQWIMARELKISESTLWRFLNSVDEMPSDIENRIKALLDV